MFKLKKEPDYGCEIDMNITNDMEDGEDIKCSIACVSEFLEEENFDSPKYKTIKALETSPGNKCK